MATALARKDDDALAASWGPAMAALANGKQRLFVMPFVICGNRASSAGGGLWRAYDRWPRLCNGGLATAAN